MAPEQVARHGDEQPEPEYEYEHGKNVCQEISEAEFALKQHAPFPDCLCYIRYRSFPAGTSASRKRELQSPRFSTYAADFAFAAPDPLPQVISGPATRTFHWLNRPLASRSTNHAW